MRAYRSAAFALVVVALGAMPGAAQDQGTVEVTPYVAIGTAGAAPVGVAVTFPLASRLDLEVDTAYRRGEGDVHAFSASASLLYDLPRVGGATPYLAAGLGLAQYGAPVFNGSGPPIGAVSSLALTVNAGGGLKMPVTSTLDLRTDARWFQSFGPHGSEQFRIAQGLSFDVGKR